MLVLLLAGGFLVRATFPDHLWEDALIHFRYVDSLLHGEGFVFNAGEKVLGTSAPLYVLLLSALGKAGLPIIETGKTLNILADVGTGALIFLILRTVVGPWAALVPVTLFVLSNHFIVWSTSGMETSLYTLLGMVSIYLYTQQRYGLMAVALALTVWMRVDGAFLAAILSIAVLFRTGLSGLKYPALSALVILPWIVFAVVYFGTPLPHTMFAKLIYLAPYRDRLAVLSEVATFFGGPLGLILALPYGAGLYAAVRRFPYLLPLVVWPPLWFAAFIIGGQFMYGWYYLPPLPAYYITIGLGIGYLVSLLPTLSRRVSLGWLSDEGHRVTIGLILASLTVLLTTKALTIPATRLAQIDRQIRSDRVDKALALWVQQESSPPARLATASIGYMGFYSGRYILDLDGLVSPQVTEELARGGSRLSVLQRAQPEFVAARVQDQSEWAKTAWFTTSYVPVAIFDSRRAQPIVRRDSDFQSALDRWLQHGSEDYLSGQGVVMVLYQARTALGDEAL
ncbi:MAG: hypothetical protein HY685_06990 [Chloroflexi bacterium]|nr:hypothetical protein [Chloroflexota bacterium]